jgi:hypothetical protein
MGNTTLIDIISSITTFGLLLLAMLRLNANASENSYAYNQNYLLQRNMIVLTVMLEDDLKHVGAGVYDVDGGVLLADTNDLKFRADLPPTGSIDTIEWKLGAKVPNSTNPNIRYLSRFINGKENKMILGVTEFTFHYWNVANPNTAVPTPVTAPATGNIGPVSVSIRLESPYKMRQQYMNDTSQYDMVWRQLRSISRNNSIQFPQ